MESNTTDHTDVLILTLDIDEVRGATVTPPELTRDTPVLDALQPPVPLILGLLRLDEEFAGSCALDELIRSLVSSLMFGTDLDSFLRERLAVHPPLWLENRLNDISGLAVAYW